MRRSESRVIGVRVLHLDGCEATPRTVRLIRDVAAALGVRIRLERVEVGNQAESVTLRFLGSPTVQIDGLDVEAEARPAQTFGLT